MGQTGRMTRMLLRAAKYVSESWQQNSEKIITIVARNEMTADRLQTQFCSILPLPSRQQRGMLLYGNIRVMFMGQSRFRNPDRLKGIREKEIVYFDHDVAINQERR